MSTSLSLSYRSCAAAFPTGYGPRGDAFAVDHIVGNVDSAHCHKKGNIDSGPTVAISTSYPLVHTDLYHLVYSDVMGHGRVC